MKDELKLDDLKFPSSNVHTDTLEEMSQGNMSTKVDCIHHLPLQKDQSSKKKQQLNT